MTCFCKHLTKKKKRKKEKKKKKKNTGINIEMVLFVEKLFIKLLIRKFFSLKLLIKTPNNPQRQNCKIDTIQFPEEF